MTELYVHQQQGVAFLAERKSAMLCDEMGLGKTRQALVAAQRLWKAQKIDRVLILAPAAVRISWLEEMNKLLDSVLDAILIDYDVKSQAMRLNISLATERDDVALLPICIVSYALLPQKRHVEALKKWCEDGKTLLVCDESSFLKNRTAKQTKGTAVIGRTCCFRWLLTGTPIANSPLDLYGQSLVMSNGSRGPLSSFKSFYHFHSRYAVLKFEQMGKVHFHRVVGYQNLDELTKRFAPYVLRRTKAECLDLPPKSYTVREIALTDATWRIYQELRKEALLALPDEDVRPEPNAAVRILRLQQLTSGHVGATWTDEGKSALEGTDGYPLASTPNNSRDVSSEKLDWLCSALLDGELSNEKSTIVWCRWRRERERLHQMLATKINVYSIFGGQQDKNRSAEVAGFINERGRGVLIGQVHAGGYGLNLAVAHTVVYMSNSFSHTDRIQSEDRAHRIGQKNAVLYIDAVAVGPRGQRTVDAHVLDCLRAKKNIAELTCKAWRRILDE